jgi:hypothetical protein
MRPVKSPIGDRVGVTLENGVAFGELFANGLVVGDRFDLVVGVGLGESAVWL